MSTEVLALVIVAVWAVGALLWFQGYRGTYVSPYHDKETYRRIKAQNARMALYAPVWPLVLLWWALVEAPIKFGKAVTATREVAKQDTQKGWRPWA